MKETAYLHGRSELVSKLQKIPALAGFSEKFIRDLLGLSKIRKYEPGEVIIQEGQYDCWMYLIISGEVKVVKEGEELTRFSRIGDLFGEMGVIDGEPRSASIYAVTNTTCLAMDASFMERLSPEDQNAFYSVLYRLFSEILATRLRETDEELTRVKKELERLKGEPTDQGSTNIYNP